MKYKGTTKERLKRRSARTDRDNAELSVAVKKNPPYNMPMYEELQYQLLISNMLHGFAYHKILVDDNNKPVDYVFLQVNDQFERFTGLKRKDIIGRKVTDVIPGIQKVKPDLIALYGDVALSGRGNKFELYFEPLRKWYLVSAFSTQAGYFTALFDDITSQKQTEESLRKSEEKFRTYYEKAPLGYQSLDRDGCLMDVNEAWLVMLGYKIDEVIGKSFAVFLTPECADRFRKGFPQFVEAGEVTGIELELVRKDNSHVIVSVDGRIGYDRGGNFMQTHCILSDVTKRRQADEEVLSISRGISTKVGKSFFNSLVEHLSQILRTEYAYVAEMIPDKPGYAQTLAFISHGVLIDNIEVNLSGTPCEKMTQGEECSYPHNVQGLFPGASVMAAMKVESYFGKQLTDSSGKMVGMMAVMGTKPVADATRIESVLRIFATRAEAELERLLQANVLATSEEKYRLLFTHERDAILLVDVKTYKIIDVNDAALQLYGYSREEMLQLQGMQISADPEKTMKGINHSAIRPSHDLRYYHLNHRKKDGTVFPVEITAGAFTLQGRRVISVIIRDITESRKAEKRLSDSEKILTKQKMALEQKNIALKEIVEQINSEKEKIRKDFAANVDKTILPILAKLPLPEDSLKYRELITYHLNELTSSFGHTISKKHYNLTLKEIEICNMIKGGLTNKEICGLLHISHQTVEKHRKNIRKKLGLTNKKMNLASYLQHI